MAKILGIDLGTTNSVVAVIEGGESVVIPLSDGARLCPSVFGVSKAGERLVGNLAKRQAITSPERTVQSVKRHMGSDYTVAIDERTYTPQEISAQILARLKQDAEAYLGETITQAVVTVPAYFSDSQRQATKDAGAIAGLEVIRIINEPTAAALAYGVDKDQIQTILVWDLGGGTFDVSILEMGDGVFEVKATSGDTHLGGDDWDQAVIDWLADEFKTETGIDLTKDRIALQRLKEASEKAKMELSAVVNTTISLPFISVGPDGPLHLENSLSRSKFEELTAPLLQRMVEPTKTALGDAQIKPEDLDRVLLVGGSTRMPAVADLVIRMFGREPHRGINPDEVVALGAAIQAGILAGDVKDIVLLDVTPLSLGIETNGGVFTRLIDRNTTIPASKTRIFTTVADNQSSVDIHVLQGEREMAANNISLGRFHLTGIKPAPRNVPQIEVTFEIDVNGIIHVSAVDKSTGNKQMLSLTASSNLSSSEVDRLVTEAEEMRKEDSQFRKNQEARNRADSLLYNSTKALIELEHKVDPAIADSVRLHIGALKSALGQKSSVEAIQNGIDALAAEVYKMSSQAYQGDPAGHPRPEPPVSEDEEPAEDIFEQEAREPDKV